MNSLFISHLEVQDGLSYVEKHVNCSPYAEERFFEFWKHKGEFYTISPFNTPFNITDTWVDEYNASQFSKDAALYFATKYSHLMFLAEDVFCDENFLRRRGNYKVAHINSQVYPYIYPPNQGAIHDIFLDVHLISFFGMLITPIIDMSHADLDNIIHNTHIGIYDILDGAGFLIWDVSK